jgi:hypothetical protein
MRTGMTSRHSLPTLVTFLAALRASGGCSFHDGEADAALGCASYATGTCQALARCGGALLAPYGSVAVCEVQLSAACKYSLGLPDVIGSGPGAAVCGEMMQSLDCDALRNGEQPSGCQAPSGLRSEGARCRTGSQCVSARCADFDGEWGVCRERQGIGNPCVTQADCGKGLVCALDGLCVPLGEVGKTCNPSRPCRAPLVCVAGSCSAVDPVQTCQGFADMFCTKLANCSPSTVRLIYGDLSVCAARNAESCRVSLQTTEGTAASAAIAGCTHALDSVRCDALLGHALPAACQLTPGPRADGAPCNSAAQCASTRCAYLPGAACGVCAPLAGLGDVCAADSDCAFGEVCAAGACSALGVVEAPCDAGHPCARPWVCAAGICVTPIGAGGECSFAADRCDRDAGLFCSASGRCEPWRNSRAGEACNQTLAGWAACSGGSSCIANRCEGPLPDGSPCASDRAPFCLAPAQCLGGVCGLPTAVSCP